MDGHGGGLCGSIGLERVGNGEQGFFGRWNGVLGPVVFGQRGMWQGMGYNCARAELCAFKVDG